MFKKILKKLAQIKNTLLSTLISSIIKKMFVSPQVSNAFYAIEQWLELFILQSRLITARIFKTYTYETPWWPRIRPLSLVSCYFQQTVPRSFQEVFHFAVRAVLSTRVIGAVVRQPLLIQGNYHAICQIRWHIMKRSFNNPDKFLCHV